MILSLVILLKLIVVKIIARRKRKIRLFNLNLKLSFARIILRKDTVRMGRSVGSLMVDMRWCGWQSSSASARKGVMGSGKVDSAHMELGANSDTRNPSGKTGQ